MYSWLVSGGSLWDDGGKETGDGIDDVVSENDSTLWWADGDAVSRPVVLYCGTGGDGTAVASGIVGVGSLSVAVLVCNLERSGSLG